MKIGILTYHAVYNFGANLQVYSTVQYLKNKGYEPLVINWVPKELEEGYNRTNPEIQAEAHRKFIREKLPLSELCRNDSDILNVIDQEKIEKIIIGSDAVLQHHTFFSRMRLTKKGIKLKPRRSNTIFPNPFWGSFIPKLKKEIPVVVMSASSQNLRYKQIRGKLRKEIGDALSRFSIITVRDEWTREMIFYLSKSTIKPMVTPDPVFAFNQNVKDQISADEIREKFNLPGKYILLSFKNEGVVSESWLKAFSRETAKFGIEAFILTMPGGIIFKNPPIKTIAPPLSPMEWYALIKNAAGYVGENMHPVIVALHNATPFFSFDNYGIVRFRYFVQEPSSKIYDILSKARFMDYRVSAVKRNFKEPSPEIIMEKLLNFDVKECGLFSMEQTRKYNDMMKLLLNN